MVRTKRGGAAAMAGHNLALQVTAWEAVLEVGETIDEEVLKQERITFRSSQIQGMPGDGGLSVQGDLTLLGATHPFAFDIEIGDGDMLHCLATLKQSDWGIKPNSALFGALKVLDEIEVEIDGHLPPVS